MCVRTLLALSSLLWVTAPASAQEVDRYVVALVPGAGPDRHLENAVHAVLECPINYLGGLVRHHYVASGPPPEGLLDGARAVLTWFDSQTAEPDWLWPWLENEVAPRKLRVIHFGEWGPLAKDTERLARWLTRFGLQWQDHYRKGPHGIEVEFRSRRLCAYEADPRFGASHAGPRSTSEANRIWVTTRTTGENASVSHPVVTGPWGAVALSPWTVRTGGGAVDRRWYLDPFTFFREALGLGRVPAPHPAVLNGRRMWFLRVDGDGFESLSSVRPGSNSAQVMKEQVFEHYALPFTVGVIVRSVTKDLRAGTATPAMEIARGILALENVEPASHGVLHTLQWREQAGDDAAARGMMSYAGIENYEYSPVAEVRESIRFINERLLDEPKRCVLMLWTGEANPLVDAIDAATAAGCVNMNGGVFRWDRWHDSVGFVSPWSRRVGHALQVYAGAANENDFAGFFDTMPSSYRHIEQTLERTGAPRILKPADLYIHFYSAETHARLRVLHDLIRRWAEREPTAPVFASTYVHAVVGAVETARTVRTGLGWRFESFGGCRSVRIDDDPRDVDLSRSRGILGSRRGKGSLWIHLARPDAEVVLARRPPRRPYVEEANCILEDAVLGEKGVAVTAVAHNARLIVFAGLPPSATIGYRLDDVARAAASDADGRLAIRLPEPGRTRVVVAAPR